MDKLNAEKILREYIQKDGSLFNDLNYTAWKPGDDKITLDGEYSPELLSAILWWMKNHK